MDELVCVTVLAGRDEPVESFSARLSDFWTHMLRDFKSDFEKVYAETTEFEEFDGHQSRQYLCGEGVVDLLERELQSADFQYLPIDREDTFTKYEAVPPEWMQIEH